MSAPVISAADTLRIICKRTQEKIQHDTEIICDKLRKTALEIVAIRQMTFPFRPSQQEFMVGVNVLLVLHAAYGTSSNATVFNWHVIQLLHFLDSLSITDVLESTDDYNKLRSKYQAELDILTAGEKFPLRYTEPPSYRRIGQ